MKAKETAGTNTSCHKLQVYIQNTPSYPKVRLTLRLLEFTVSTKAKGSFTPSKDMVTTTFQLLYSATSTETRPL